uniref:Uncharacterized protein n=1 Tax=Pseudo-nitzschia australis TaxID=44445 RepID=A0A7S4ADH6_9STRA|mmetsp:Transcript_25108/g.55066  ORF Transcript_25108/g.55066 Transcript_25108/m.55066 type:complete len:392 (-) Transcript_25108:138-1313(-)|eukprot:CAMPEP_0168173728 /NCGR_PEP_ID=MMETSP0139_2-20121125/6072_1 /TAXON_ID=44445 /ORGANISM="Pseudo-nitzschia australis, Strain 10249 10 AB" /LENGTH=391 /DNA_ID=CAMNT_0008091725 /DNA_START=99 /DNA_END=1274 /DNA_ORIENTATION=+
MEYDPEKRHPKGESFQGRNTRWIMYIFLGLAVLSFLIAHPSMQQYKGEEEEYEEEGHRRESEMSYLKARKASGTSTSTTTSTTTTTTTEANTAASTSTQQDFRAVAHPFGTDKVAGHIHIQPCLDDNSKCLHPSAGQPTCRVWGHFYDTIYNRWLGKYSTEDADPIQFLEIGFYKGKGFESYTNFLPTAEKHSMEISCIEPGERSEGKWPWGNFPQEHRWYQSLLDSKRLHCGDASDYDFLKTTWTEQMNRPDAPPLMVVVDDGAHIDSQMAQTLFFWFPRIQPGGILVVEDIQPIPEANKFRTHIVPQVMKDLHWCGGSARVSVSDTLCFPTIQPLLKGIHCEMHICVFVRNDAPAYEPDEVDSKTPPGAFTDAQKCLFGPHEAAEKSSR